MQTRSPDDGRDVGTVSGVWLAPGAGQPGTEPNGDVESQRRALTDHRGGPENEAEQQAVVGNSDRRGLCALAALWYRLYVWQRQKSTNFSSSKQPGG